MLSLRHLFRTYRRRRAARIDWGRRHAKVFSLHPELGKLRDPAAEKAHLDLWHPLRKDISLATYRICANLSGIDDPRFVPEELFVSELQDYLYPDPRVRELADKNTYDRWFGKTGGPGRMTLEPVGLHRLTGEPAVSKQTTTVGAPVHKKPVINSCPWSRRAPPDNVRAERLQGTGPRTRVFPKSFLRKMGGRFFDADYNLIPVSELARLVDGLPYPVVCKPSRDSFGGQNIAFCESAEQLEGILKPSEPVTRDLIIQEHIQPHDFFSRFSPVGLNTLRVYCYRDAESDNWTVLNVTLRMGVGGSLDNETAGGIACSIDNDGRLNQYALDKYAGKFYAHPDCGIKFAGLIIPEFEQLKYLSLLLASGFDGVRLIGLDMCMDKDGRWRCLEINLGMQTIRFAQYAGKPFFGAFTEHVIAAVRTQKS